MKHFRKQWIITSFKHKNSLKFLNFQVAKSKLPTDFWRDFVFLFPSRYLAIVESGQNEYISDEVSYNSRNHDVA